MIYRNMTDVELDEQLDELFNRICADFGNVLLNRQMELVLVETEKRLQARTNKRGANA